MNRRNFLISGGLAVIAPCGAAAETGTEIRVDGVAFDWWHSEDRLYARLEVPTTGWAAVGFNTENILTGTRFVIAAGAGPDPRAEEHIAEPPNHRRVRELDLAPAVADLTLAIKDGGSRLSFSLPHHFSDTPNPVLAPGRKSYLMLAWSRSPDFDHHSAWRRHFEITL